MRQSKKCILLIYQDFSSFVRYDYQILSKKHKVVLYRLKISKNIFRTIYYLIRFLLFFFRNIFRVRIIYCWFADYHSILPAFFSVIFKKPFFISVGGYDAIYIPELKYGVYSNFFRSFCAGYALKHAVGCLCVTDSIINNLKKRFGERVNLYIIPTGYDVERFTFRKEHPGKCILTVGLVSDYKTLRIKGLNRFAELARLMPDYRFIMVGVSTNMKIYLEPVSDNLEIYEPVEHSKLVSFYHQARVYTQLSIDEGLPNAVCEAMLCGCIPVGTKAGGIPMAIGNVGFLINEWNIEECIKLIHEAFDSKNDQLGKRARDYIIRKFTLDKREASLNKLFDSF
ncbi:MAG: glycosyltransferase family 4 protein [Candidatus Atribacteria bacterium]|nr:glycosyltransferase family 4 protein [Candidatus Atribacteria bacterium]